MKTITIILTAAALGLGNLSAGLPDPKNTPQAIFDSDPSHLWNRVHHAFFLRPDTGSESLNPDAVDPPLWRDTSTFLKSGLSHQKAIEALDEFLADGHSLISDPLKRAVMQHDLWSVFDWSARTYTSKIEDTSLAENLDELRSRLGKAIQKLTLSPDQIAALPDNLANTASTGAFNAAYDPEHPRTPFLPSDLLDPGGPWVCVRGAMDGPSAPVHVRYYSGRSPFLVFLQLPGGREATLDYLDALNQATGKLTKDGDTTRLPLFPVGTKTALLRQMTVIDDSGQIQLTPITQTLQMRVYRQVGHDVTDHDNSQAAVKFRTQRRELFAAGHTGMIPVAWDEPLQVSLLQHNDRYDTEHAASGIKTTMQSCIACHSCGGATVQSIFTYQQDEWVPGAQSFTANQLSLTTTTPAAELEQILAWKKQRSEWQLLIGQLESR